MKEDLDGTGGSRTTKMIERGTHVPEAHLPRSKNSDEDPGARYGVSREDRPRATGERPQDQVLAHIHEWRTWCASREGPVQRLPR